MSIVPLKDPSDYRSPVAEEVVDQAELARRTLTTETDYFLTGIHEPMRREVTLESLPVEGRIPAGLHGRYVRIGPNPVSPDPRGYHWFAGDGMLHALAIRDGEALWYRNRWIRSTPVAAALGEQPAPGPRIGRHDTVNTNVVGLAGRTLALIEAGSFPVAMTEELDEQVYDGFGGTLGGTFSAHPHRDPSTGNLHAIAYEGGNLNSVRHVVVSPDGEVLYETPISVEDGPSIHDCAITRRHVLVLDLPVTFSLDALKSGQRFPYRWNAEHAARVGVLPLAGESEDIVWCDVDPCYVFHTGNAFESGGIITLDVVAYERMFDGQNDGPSGQGLGVERWTIDPSRRRVERRRVDATPQEFPRFNEACAGLPYRFLYTVATATDGSEHPTTIYKHDMESGTRSQHDFGPGRIPGEFVFVARHDSAQEDGGWLVGLVINTSDETTDLVFLDAEKIEGEPVARVRLPHRIPPGFHGNWIPAC